MVDSFDSISLYFVLYCVFGAGETLQVLEGIEAVAEGEGGW